MSLDPPLPDRVPVRMPTSPPLDWPPAPAAEQLAGGREPEGWAGWQVALIAVTCLLAGALAGVLLSDRDDEPLAQVVPTTTTTTTTVVEQAGGAEDGAGGPAGSGQGGPTGEGIGSERSPVPAGTGMLLDEWVVGAWVVHPDGEAAVLSFDPANVPPRQGYTFVLASTDLTYVGTRTGNPSDLKLYSLDRTGRAYGPTCGIVPSPLLASVELGRGDSINGQVCFEVPEQAVDGLRLVIEERLGIPVVFELN